MTVGTLTLRRFNGVESFPVVSAEMLLYNSENSQCLNLEVETDEDGTKTTTDTAEHPAAPNAEVSIYRDLIEPSKLVGQRFVVTSAYDDEADDWVSRFYYYEHEGIDENVVEFFKFESGRYHVRWTGKTIDPNYYDGSKPDTFVEIDAQFSLKDSRT